MNKNQKKAAKRSQALAAAQAIADKRSTLVDFFLSCSEAWSYFKQDDQSGLCFDIADKLQTDPDSRILAVWDYCQQNWIGSELERKIARANKAA